MTIVTGKTKEKNTFRFKSFGDRVNEIDIRRSALYYIGHVNEELPEDDETYFHQTLKKWTVLNLTEEYNIFSRKCQKIVTLPQLIHQKDFVIDLLLERLSIATTLSLQPLLELVYVLAKDLRDEFYPHFQRVLERLICLLNTQDAEQLEWTLVCLAYLFKILKPYLRKNMGVVFYIILPLLDEQMYPEHITNFAVECFSFIARDIRDYKKFLDFILETVQREQSDCIQGCGRLLFEIMKGVKGMFHSIAGDFLQFIFQYLVSEEERSLIQENLLKDIIQNAVANLLHFIQPHNMNLFWLKLSQALKSLTNPKKLENLMEIFLMTSEYKDGRYLAEMEVIVPSLLSSLDLAMEKDLETALRLCCQIVATMLLSGSTMITQLDTSRLLKKTLTLEKREIYDDFIQAIATHTQFEILVLPKVISYFENHFDEKAFELLSKIVLMKKPLSKNSLTLENWKPYTLPLKNEKTAMKINEMLNNFSFNTIQLERQVMLLILLPHLIGIQKSLMEEKLKIEAKRLADKLSNSADPNQENANEVVDSVDANQGVADNSNQGLAEELVSEAAPNQGPKLKLSKSANLNKQLAEQLSISATPQQEQDIILLGLIIETSLHLDFHFEENFVKSILESLIPFIKNINALNLVNQLLWKSSPRYNFTDNLIPLLSSYSQEIRLLAAHSLFLLHKTAKDEEKNAYKLMFDIECMEPNVHNYREQLLLLQKFETQGEFFKSLKKPLIKKHILYFLLGLLYNNFKLLWEPIQKLIEQYSKEMETEEFWQIFKGKLIEATKDIELNIQKQDEQQLQKEKGIWSSSLMNKLMPSIIIDEMNQTAVLNYRNLLWQGLANYHNVAEIKNREMIVLFFDFIEKEYRTNIEKQQFTLDLTQGIQVSNEDLLLVKESSLKEMIWKYQDNTKRNIYLKSILNTLQGQLRCFVKQPNPKALYRESELFRFYMDLLAGPNPLLQKLSLDCVFAYKSKNLQTYKESLYAFLDEKTFKNELITFQIADIKEDSREEVMKLLLRILHSKMITKGSLKQMRPQARKAMILRFLGQCRLDEILWFLKMSFGHLDTYTKEDFESIPAKVKRDFNLSACWSPSKLKNILNLLELIRKEFGGIMEKEFHFYLLKLILFIGSVSNLVLTTNPHHIQENMPIVFKNIKTEATQNLINFFNHIKEFEWSPHLIEIFTIEFIHPSLEKLSKECLHSPTVLLKLLLKWSEETKYYHFLNQNFKGKSLIHYMIDLLENQKIKASVRKPLLEMIERLLQAAVVNDNEQFVLEMLKPFIPQILQNIKQSTLKRSAKQGIDKLELSILSLITPHVEDSQTCESLLEILLPLLIKRIQTKVSSDDIVCQIITTLTNLIKRLENPLNYLRKISPLFEFIQDIPARKMLCHLISDIAKTTIKNHPENLELIEQMKQTARFVLMLNAWDKRWLEQPDYDKRLTALKEIHQLLEESKVDMNLGLLIIYNCFYYLKYDKDMGLRDNASELLQSLLPNLVEKYSENKKDLNYLVGEIFLNLVTRTLQDSNDNVRNEGIRLLGVMVRKCSYSHEILQDLQALSDSQDPEIDFFENLIHLQTHRHGRALLRFCNHSSTLTKPPNVRTLTQIILPLASRYLLNEKHSSKHTLVDAAIDAIGMACQLLPWQHYHTILRYYLSKMRHTHDHQKQSVRIVVRILDAFHFDVSQAEAKPEDIQKFQSALNESNSRKQKPKENTSENVKSVEDSPHSKKKILTRPKLKQESKQNENDNDNDTDDDDEELLENAEVEENNSDLLSESGDSEDSGLEEDNLDFSNDSSEDTKGVMDTPSCENVLSKPLLLTSAAAKRVITTITSVLIPMLNRSITEKSSYDNKHKVNRKRLSFEREEEEILRVPIALALVKLMQKLPKEILDSGVSGVFMKVCTFLRSPLKSVRMLTRDILKKIMLTLGPSYLSILMEHLQSLLTRGFQVHVLSVTVHGVLDALKMIVQPSDLANCLHNLLEVALNDIFGATSAEKEVDKIVAHTPEAKASAKSYLILHILARNIPESCLLDILIPFKDHLAKSHSKKLIVKIQDCFAKIVGGLVENVHISRESLLIFIYGTMSESITDLLPGIQKRVLSEKEKETMRRARPDCFIIPQEPRMRSGVINKNIKTNAQANAHILIEFGLELLHFVLKRKKLVQVDYQPFLNPILPLLKDALKSTHIRVTTFALKSLTAIWNDDYDLPSLKEYLPEIVGRMFEILKNFSTFGATKQEDNSRLVKATFKAIVSLLRKCEGYNLTEEQIDQLLLYIEQDFQEGENQTICFSLMKAILNRKVQTEGIHDIMKRIGDLAIVSHSDYVRNECRSLLIFYIVEYPLKKKIEQIIKSFSAQLCYSLATGRKSAIAIFFTIIKKFPLPILSKQAEFLYLSLSTRLINDEDPECRKDLAEALEMLISRLSKVDRQRLFDLTIVFFEATKNKPSVREMAAAMVIRFLNVEKQTFESRLKLILPTVVARLTLDNPTLPGRFVRLPNPLGFNQENQPKKKPKQHFIPLEGDDSEVMEEKQRALDHELIQMQFCILKMLEYCLEEIFNNKDLSHTVDELAYESQRLLGHDHSWVRCNAAKIINCLIANYDFNLIAQKLIKLPIEQSTNLDFIYLNPEYDIKSLILDICAQFVPGETSTQMIDEIVKLFLFVGNMLRDVPFSIKKEKIKMEVVGEDGDKKDLEDLQTSKVHLSWLIHNVRYLINKEVAKAPHSTSMRSAMFTLIEGFCTLLSVESLEKLSPALLSVLVREMSEEDQNVDADLRQKALHVGSRLRKRIGPPIYDKLRTTAQTNLMIRRAERKKVIAQEKIHDPVRAAKRKINIQERKKVMKKRKVQVMRGKAQDVKQKLKKRKRKAEEDLF